MAAFTKYIQITNPPIKSPPPVKYIHSETPLFSKSHLFLKAPLPSPFTFQTKRVKDILYNICHLQCVKVCPMNKFSNQGLKGVAELSEQLATLTQTK